MQLNSMGDNELAEVLATVLVTVLAIVLITGSLVILNAVRDNQQVEPETVCRTFAHKVTPCLD